jgi:hypothetical protein
MSDNENNYIEEVYAITNKPVVESEPITSTELKIKGSNNDQTSSLLLGLLDTGATGTYVAASALQKINHTIEPINVQVCGCYSSVTATKMATLKVQLPDFCNSKTITLHAYVDDAPVGVHDIILGTHVCQQLGLIFDFKHRLVHWDELSMVMKEHGTINKAMLNAVDNDDSLLLFLQQATLRLTKGISENTYNKHDYHEMIQRCTHLSSEQRNTSYDFLQTTKIYSPVNLVLFLVLLFIYV